MPIDVTNYPVASGSTVTLTFPSTYTISMTLGVNAQVNSGAVLAPAFGIAGSVLTLTGLFPAQTTVYNLTLSISNVLNPSPAITTGPFTGTIGDDASQSINQYSVVSLSPAKFSLCYMSFTPKYVYRTSAMVFNLTAKTALPVDGTIQIQFPSNVWSRDISTTNFLPITNIMTCGTLSSVINSFNIERKSNNPMQRPLQPKHGRRKQHVQQRHLRRRILHLHNNKLLLPPYELASRSNHDNLI